MFHLTLSANIRQQRAFITSLGKHKDSIKSYFYTGDKHKHSFLLRRYIANRNGKHKAKIQGRMWFLRRELNSELNCNTDVLQAFSIPPDNTEGDITWVRPLHSGETDSNNGTALHSKWAVYRGGTERFQNFSWNSEALSYLLQRQIEQYQTLAFEQFPGLQRCKTNKWKTTVSAYLTTVVTGCWQFCKIHGLRFVQNVLPIASLPKPWYSEHVRDLDESTLRFAICACYKGNKWTTLGGHYFTPCAHCNPVQTLSRAIQQTVWFRKMAIDQGLCLNDTRRTSEHITVTPTVLERKLLILLERCPWCIARTASKCRPHILSTITADIAQSWTAYYRHNKLLQGTHDELLYRLKLSQRIKEALQICSSILGIQLP